MLPKPVFIFLYLLLGSIIASSQPKPYHNLQYTSMPTQWDEGLPLGNGTLGTLIWQKGNKLRFSLDNVFCWDDRPMPKIDSLNFALVIQKLASKDYQFIQRLGDEPYEANPAPTKIPAAAFEIDIASFGKIRSAELDIKTAMAMVEWESGLRMETFINAAGNAGVFSFKGLQKEFALELVPPVYQQDSYQKVGNSVQGQGLEQLGYSQGKRSKVEINGTCYQTYDQQCYGNTAYKVIVCYKIKGDKLNGYWTVKWIPDIHRRVKDAPIDTNITAHKRWWDRFWKASSVSIPDSNIEKQYYRELYKFGSVARYNTPPISLQAIWTADNGRLPPWKGDFHHDLNTQLSYWPGYTSNHLDLTAGFTNWLWKTKEVNKKWTKQYFELDGLNVPGVTTISGAPMGGWIQYSMSPTTIAWLSQHFYWQYKYSLDPGFLQNICYPYIKEAERYLTGMLKAKGKGYLQLPLSSSPEIYDNDSRAWFNSLTNYDLALLKSFYGYCMEIYSLQKDDRLEELRKIQTKLPPFAINEKGLQLVSGQDLEESHRHLSPYMAIYPLQLLHMDHPADTAIINNSIRWIEKLGTRAWCGYSFSWMSCVYAKGHQSENALRMLQIFASNFVSNNSFHLNGDQKKGEYSSFTYRPFTLEGNFAFAQGVHELLMQCDKEVISVFPALPEKWKDVSFINLRSQNAFLVTAVRSNGVNRSVRFIATEEAELRCRVPFKKYNLSKKSSKGVKIKDGVIFKKMKKGESISFRNAEAAGNNPTQPYVWK